MPAREAWYLVAESGAPGCARTQRASGPRPSHTWIVSELFFSLLFSFFLVPVAATSKAGTNSEKELGGEAATLLYLPLFPPPFLLLFPSD